LMENAAWRAVANSLEEGDVTVGTVVNVRHLAATPLGQQVRAQLYIEIKTSKRRRTYEPYPNIAEKVVELINSKDMLDQVLIISFDWMIFPVIKSLKPTIETGMIVSDKVWNPRTKDGMQLLVEKAVEYGCEWINMDYKLFTIEMLQTIHTHGLKLGLWTVNTEADMLRFATAGVDSLTSDRPDLFSVLTV